MGRIEEIDQNFAVKDTVVREHVKNYSVCRAPFSLHGLFAPLAPGEPFFRMPRAVADEVSQAVSTLSTHCAGGRIRFKTNSSYIAIHVAMGRVGKMPHFALTGSAGFDLYVGEKHLATFAPKFDIVDELFGEYRTGEQGIREYTLNFPLYSEVKGLSILLDEDAVVEPAEPYRNDRPVVFYGSSITQGGCASRPGLSYSAMVSRDLNLDYWNLGFSGSAKGERTMAEYVAGLDMSAFVLDYDHNAPSVEHLLATHERFYTTVREKHPDIPILCLTRPFARAASYEQRREIVEQTVLRARARGDENVYFIAMSDYLEGRGVLELASVDNTHPNDLGFYFMARAVSKVLRQAFDIPLGTGV